MKNTDLHVKILLLKYLENQCKIMVPLLGAAAAPNKGTTILY